LSATLGLDDSAYRQGVEEAKSQAKAAVSTMMKDYNRLYSEVIHLTAAYQKSREETGETSKKTKEFAQKLKEAQAQLNTTAQGLKTAEGYMNSFGDSTRNTESSLAGSIAKGQILGNVLTTLASKALDAAVGFVQTGIEYNAQIEKYTTGFTNMLGSAEAANEAMKAIQEDAARTPFDVASLTEANQLLISAGENAGYSRKVIMALGDAVSATGGGNVELSRMAGNLQQIANVGKATAVDIKQFAYAGINIYQVLADYTGKSTAEVQKMTITYDLLTAALQKASEEGGRYYNAMETQSQTLSGRLDTLRDNWSQFLGSLSEGLADVEGDLVSAAAEWVQTLQTSFEEYGAKGLMEAGGSIVNDIANGIADRIPQLAEQAGAAVQHFSDYLVENMGTIVETGGNLLASLADGILNAFPDVANAAAQTVGTLVSELWANADKIFEQGAQLVGKLCEGLLSVLGNVIEATGTIAEAIVTKIFSTDWGAVGKNIVSAIGQGISNGVASLSGPLDRLSYKLNHALGKVGYAEYNSFEAWAAANGKTDETEYQHGSQKDDNYWKRYGARLAAQYGLNEKTEPEPTGTDGDGTGGTSGKTTTPKHVAADTKKLADTIKETSQEILAGTGNIVGSIQRVTETADNTYNVYDGTTKELKGTTKETVQTITDSWTEVVDGTEKTIKKITKNVTDAAGKVTTTTTQTCDKVVLSVSEMQKRIDNQLSEAQSKWKSGIMGTLQSTISDLKNGNWSGLATDFAKLVWGEVTQEQRNIISKWLTDALTAVNDSYSGGGLSAAKDTIKALFGDGIAEGATEAGTAVKSFSQILDGLNASGGVDTKLAGIAGSFTNAAGTITKALSGIVGFIVSNPVVAVVLGLTALVGGAALSAWSKNKGEKLTNNYESPFSKTPVYDSLAEFSYRADQFNRYKGLTASPFSGGQQDTTGRQQLSVLQRISNSLDEHLPAIGTGTLVIDANGVQALAGAMQPTLVDGIDGDLGIRSTRKARGG
jgi:tape measure domain-containing protein